MGGARYVGTFVHHRTANGNMGAWARSVRLFGASRVDTDRIENIVILGVNTFGGRIWCRGLMCLISGLSETNGPLWAHLGIWGCGHGKRRYRQRRVLCPSRYTDPQCGRYGFADDWGYCAALDGNGAVLLQVARNHRPIKAHDMCSGDD